MKIKICGLTRECDIDFVNEAMPDYVGFVFAESKRRVTPEQALKLSKHLDKKITAVGVFVDSDPELINSLIESKVIHMAQLHGNESDEFISQISAPVIKAVRLGESINRPADYLLFDSPRAGSGTAFDWSKLPQTTTPFFLAGGINLNNISEAMLFKPYGIDVSSGVETNGFKDREKIIEMVRRVRNV